MISGGNGIPTPQFKQHDLLNQPGKKLIISILLVFIL